MVRLVPTGGKPSAGTTLGNVLQYRHDRRTVRATVFSQPYRLRYLDARETLIELATLPFAIMGADIEKIT